MMTMKQARIGAELTQDQIAKKMGVHINTYRRWEEEPLRIPMGKAIEFCEIVKLPIGLIFFA